MEEFKLDAIMHHAYNLRILKKYDEATFWYEKLSELSTSKYYDEAVLEGLAKCATMVNNFEKEREKAGIKGDTISPMVLPHYTWGNPEFDKEIPGATK
mgnify:CR=1 FL=1